jgi:hypothetical protein
MQYLVPSHRRASHRRTNRKEVAMSAWKSSAALVATLAIATQLAGCAAIQGIFKAGVWVGIVAMVLLFGLVAMLFKLARH